MPAHGRQLWYLTRITTNSCIRQSPEDWVHFEIQSHASREGDEAVLQGVLDLLLVTAAGRELQSKHTPATYGHYHPFV